MLGIKGIIARAATDVQNLRNIQGQIRSEYGIKDKRENKVKMSQPYGMQKRLVTQICDVIAS